VATVGSEHMNLTSSQCEYPAFQGLMCPHPSTQYHPAYPMLLQFAINGCPVNCGPTWTLDQLQAAVDHGNHPSASTPEAIKCLCKEMFKKVNQGHAQIIPWDKLCKNPPPNAVPHKSCPFWGNCGFVLPTMHINIPSSQCQ